MAVVKGSKQEKLTVVSYDPWTRFFRRFFVLILIAALAGAAYFYGRFEALQVQARAVAERDQLLVDLEQAEEKIATFSQRVIMLEKGGEVDRRSTEGLRQNMVDLRQQIASLQEEVAFYKGIMAPSSRKQDLRVQKVEINPMIAERSFRYKIVVTQVGTNQTYVSGLAAVNVIGALNGQQKTYGLRDISDDVQDYGIKYRFRYFQEIEGEMVMPEGFEPEFVEVVLQSSGSRSKRLEKSFPWPGKEQTNAE